MLLLCRCATSPEARLQTAQQLASGAGLQQQDVSAAPFVLRSYLRFQRPQDGVTRIYIEGDGLAWLDRKTPSPDPTPRHPIGLGLAAVDPGPNVVYLARPCQYVETLADGRACPQAYWTNALFAPDVVAAYGQALDSLKAQYHFRQIELVGYSGGGGLAALIAAGRTDVVSLRTVAGNLDSARFTELHGVSPLSGSRNPVEAARRLSALPQLHFVGDRDHVVTIDLLQSFQAASGNSRCVKGMTVPGMDHYSDWPAVWRTLLNVQPACL